MKFNIIYDRPGRIRLRCGQYSFSQEYEYSIKLAVEQIPSVKSAEVHYENGGILVRYENDAREEILDAVRKIRISELLPKEEDGIAAIDKRFQNDLVKIVVRRLINKCLLPNWIANFITFAKGILYIKKALSTLCRGKLTVDVLDGASIAACLCQRNCKTAGTIMFMLSVSALLEDYTRAKTKAALTESLAVKADKVWLVTGEQDILVPLSQIKVGDVIRVRMGSIIPVDGEVTDGEASVNESSMTGEPLCVMRSKGDSIFAGTVLEEGNIAVKVRNIGSDTKIRKIIELIDNSENLKAGVQSRAETLADSIVPFSFIGFGLTLLLTRNVTKAVSLLMVDYSCAIKLSTPIAVISAIREAADHDITVKGGKFLESFAAADSVVFDKTGTLTNAEPALDKVVTFGGFSEDEVLRTAACIEEHFPHSVARAIVKAAAERRLAHEEEHADVQYIVAHGIATELHGKRAVIGSKHFVAEDEGITITEEQQLRIDEQAGACSVVYLAVGGELVGALCISDPPRSEAAETIEFLKQAGITNIVMLTGDSVKAAEATSKMLGITEYHAQVLPEDKHGYVERLKEEGHKVIMVGDGINDAPALAAANVSVAMSDASDIAREAADITLRGAKLTELAVLRTLSERLMERINANYRFILTFNSALLILGFSGVITPAVSAFLHNASTMAICAKSMTSLLNEK